MREIGIDVFEYENFEPDRFDFERFEPLRFEIYRFEPDKIETLFLSRGVIGINKVGCITDVV